jgi:thiamine biosynthesis lipoprotein
MGFRLDTETRSLFNHALTCYEQSNGLFDITSGILRQVWDFKSGRVPDQSEIDKLLPLIGFHKLNFRKSRLYMPQGSEIDFGGIVKEYAADSVARLARSRGIESGLVNLGGDFAVIGPLPENRPWPVGIIHPSGGKMLMARLKIGAGGLASSGDYERSFVHEGKRYSHILNPKTGWPCDGLRAVSVCSDLCTLAGSAATIAMVKPEAEGIAWLQGLGLDHVYMKADEEIGGQGFETQAAQTDEAASEAS